MFEDLKNVLYMDDAVAGEAAGIGMGLLCCGSGSDKTQEMLAYAHDTQVGALLHPRRSVPAACEDPPSSSGHSLCCGRLRCCTGWCLIPSGSRPPPTLLSIRTHTAPCAPPCLGLQHEKIIRGLAMGLALISYGIEEAADTLIEQMAREQDPILRYGAMYVLGMAYRYVAVLQWAVVGWVLPAMQAWLCSLVCQ